MSGPLIVSVITMHIDFILDVKRSKGGGYLYLASHSVRNLSTFDVRIWRQNTISATKVLTSNTQLVNVITFPLWDPYILCISHFVWIIFKYVTGNMNATKG